MSKKKILIIAQEMEPYTALSEIAQIANKLPLYLNDNQCEIRILMPRFGTINERRHRLHEVVRLSGMNIIVNDDDYPLIIKVASLPGSRIQVYFLDNEEFFKFERRCRAVRFPSGSTHDSPVFASRVRSFTVPLIQTASIKAKMSLVV